MYRIFQLCHAAYYNMASTYEVNTS